MNIFEMLVQKAINGGGGGGSVEMETGTKTPTAEDVSLTITFSKTHETAPALFFLYDDGDNMPSLNSVMFFGYFDLLKIMGDGYARNDTGGMCYARRVYTYRGSSAESNVSGGFCAYPSTDSGDSSASYPRFFAKEDSFRAYIGGYYYRTTRSYKWTAIWL